MRVRVRTHIHSEDWGFENILWPPANFQAMPVIVMARSPTQEFCSFTSALFTSTGATQTTWPSWSDLVRLDHSMHLFYMTG